MAFIQSLGLTYWQLILIIIAAFLVGFSKTGISGFTMLVIPILASVFGGKDSTGILLPMLLVGDVFAVLYYHRHAEWKAIRKLLPWAFLGILIGSLVGGYVNDYQFKTIIAVSLFICLGILIYTETKGESFKVPERTWLYVLTGIAAGVATMIGNAAGPIFSIYLLAKGFKKNDYMGTASWFFFIVNFTKVPIQVFYWHNITLKTFLTACVLIPVITLGALLGARVIKKLNEKPFRYIIIVVTAISAVRLLM